MGVRKYQTMAGATFWQADVWVKLPDRTLKRIVKRKIPTREMALDFVAKARIEAFEGRYFPERQARARTPILTVAGAWETYEPTGKRDNDSHDTDRGRAAHLIRLLGKKVAASLSLREVEEYRTARLTEKTQRGRAPSPATLDREIELLKRTLNYAVACGKLSENPIAHVKLLRVPSVRRVVLDDETFQRLHGAAEPWLKPILLVAFETGMRKEEILLLRWKGQADAYGLDLKAGSIMLADDETKTDEPRMILLTARVVTALRGVARRLDTPCVFVNPETGETWRDIKKAFARAREKAGLTGPWFHDLRRSFITRARRAGVDESTVMRFSGHRTRAVLRALQRRRGQGPAGSGTAARAAWKGSGRSRRGRPRNDRGPAS